MYGTIARLHPLPGRLEDLKALPDGWRSEPPAGFIAAYIFEPDQAVYDRPTAFLVAVFEDEATYRANADSPEQDREYRQMRALLADDPDWMDGSFTAAL